MSISNSLGGGSGTSDTLDDYQLGDTSVLDSAFPFAEPAKQPVAKSAPDDDNQCLHSLFQPVWDFHNRADVSKSLDATELMNRTDTRPSTRNSATGKKPTGRPRKPRTPLSEFDAKNPRTVIGIVGEKIEAGSVLQVRLPDGSERFLVLRTDVLFDWLD